MRVNVYAEEMTNRIEIVTKEINGVRFTGLRFYLELPVTQWRDPSRPELGFNTFQGPFMHKPDDDDSSAVTFWGKRDLRDVLRQALELLERYYTMQRG